MNIFIIDILQSGKKQTKGTALIEALAAIVIVSIVAAISAPAFLVALLTRIESRNIIQARGLAQLEVDNTRETLLQSPTYTSASLPPAITGNTPSALVAYGAPTSYTCTASPCSNAAQARIVYLNNKRFLVQTFRTPGYSIYLSGLPVSFRMGVRVWGPSSLPYISSGGSLQTSDNYNTNGLQSSLNNEAQYPLAVIYIILAKTNLTSSGNNYAVQSGR